MKVRIIAYETLRYQREIEAEVPEDMSEDAIFRAILQAERGSDSIEMFAFKLNSLNVSVKEWDDDLSSPEKGIIEVEEIEIEGKEEEST